MEGLTIHRCKFCKKTRTGCTDLNESEQTNFCISCDSLQVEGKCPKNGGNESPYGKCSECFERLNHIPEPNRRDPILVKKRVIEESGDEESSSEKDVLSCPSARGTGYKLDL